MSAVKNHFWDQINAEPEPYEGLIPEECDACERWFVEVTDGLCEHCAAEYHAKNGGIH